MVSEVSSSPDCTTKASNPAVRHKRNRGSRNHRVNREGIALDGNSSTTIYETQQARFYRWRWRCFDEQRFMREYCPLYEILHLQLGGATFPGLMKFLVNKPGVGVSILRLERLMQAE